MHTRPLLALLLALPLGLGCERSAPPSTTAPPVAPAPPPTAPTAAPSVVEAPGKTQSVAYSPMTYGAKVSAAQATPIAEVLAAPDGFAQKTMVVEGYVRAACSKKGCWMELAQSADPQAPGCRVTFKDYGFFVPTDSAGAMARVEGTAMVKTLSAGEADHYASEGAHFNRRPDGTAREVRLVATGVELRRGS